MDENNELNDIILKKNTQNNTQKKILLAVATFAIILIIAVIIINQMNKSTVDVLPKTVSSSKKVDNNDFMFEEIEVVEDTLIDDTDPIEADLNSVTQKLKREAEEESPDMTDQHEIVIVDEEDIQPLRKIQEKPKKITPAPIKKETHVKKVVKKTPVKKVTPVKKSLPPKKKSTPTQMIDMGETYIQVGSFNKYTPNKHFLDKITKNGYEYTYFRVMQRGKTVNKVIIGPFKNRKSAHNALMSIRKNIEPGAFIISSLK